MEQGAERERVETFGRLENGLRAGGRLVPLGPVRERAPVGHGARGLQRGRDGLGVPPARPRALARVPLGRGRARRVLRRRAAALPRARALERPRPDPEGAHLRADRATRATTARTPRSTGGTSTRRRATAWNRWRYHYPQARVPVRATSSTRTAAAASSTPSTSCSTRASSTTTATGSSRSHYAKADPLDVLLTRPGHERRPGGRHAPRAADGVVPQHVGVGGRRRRPPSCGQPTTPGSTTEHPFLGPLELAADDGPDGSPPELLFCDNETNAERLFGTAAPRGAPEGRDQRPRRLGRGDREPAAGGDEGGVPGTGSRSPPGETVELRVRLRPRRSRRRRRGPTSTTSWRTRARTEADEFYAELTPPACARRRGERDAPGVRRDAVEQAALLLRRRSAGSTATRRSRRRPASRHGGRNARWRNFDAFDIMSMPDTWEYPWFAAWDIAFHCVALAHVDPAFAKYQLILLCREWFQHPNGALPAYEWSFDDVNPPVQAWAALEVFAIDGGRDIDFLSRDLRQAARQLHVVGEPPGRGRLERLRGRLPRPRQHRADRPLAPARRATCSSSPTRPAGWRRTRSAWPRSPRSSTGRGRPATDLVREVPRALRAHLRGARDAGPLGRGGRLLLRPAAPRPTAPSCRSRCARWSASCRCSAFAVVDENAVEPGARTIGQALRAAARPARSSSQRTPGEAMTPAAAATLVGVVGVEHLLRVFARLFDEERVPLAVRAARRLALAPRAPVRPRHRRHTRRRSTTSRPSRRPAMFGGNSNWRGPIWFPVNYLVVERAPAATRATSATSSRSSTRPAPGSERTLERDRRGPPRPADLALPRRRGRAAALLRLGRAAPDRSGLEGQHPLQRVLPRRQRRRASAPRHQTGWTGIVADMIRRQRRRRHPDARRAPRAARTTEVSR